MLLKELEILINETSIDEFQLKLNENLENLNLNEVFENGETLYHRLIRKKINESTKIKVIFKLSDAGLDINVQNKLKQTCLHLAILGGLLDVVYCLLQNGADLTITDHVILLYKIYQILNFLTMDLLIAWSMRLQLRKTA